MALGPLIEFIRALEVGGRRAAIARSRVVASKFCVCVADAIDDFDQHLTRRHHMTITALPHRCYFQSLTLTHVVAYNGQTKESDKETNRTTTQGATWYV